MAVLRLHKAAEETGSGKSTIAIESGCMSAELIEDGGTPKASLRQLPAPETIATSDLAANSRPPMPPSQTFRSSSGWSGPATTSWSDLDDLKRDRDEWRERAERLIERPWWRRLAG